MIVRLATPDDDAELAALMESIPMPGAIRLAFGCRPSFFNALRVEGSDPVVTVAVNHGEIVGVGAVTFRKAYLNGRVENVGYLNSMRVAYKARGSSAMAMGFRRMREALLERPVDLTLTSILADNSAALRILTKKRPTLPTYESLCVCKSRVMAAGMRLPSRVSSRIEVGPAADAEELCGFLNLHGPRRNFFPLCRVENLDGRLDSVFPGLTYEDFLVAKDGSGIVGVMGCWDVMKFRQALVNGYSTPMKLLRPFYNFGAGWAGYPRLPAAGSVLRMAFGALTVVKNDDPSVLRAMLAKAMEQISARRLDYFVFALAEDDPLAAAFIGLPCREITSRIFRVQSGESASSIEPDKRIRHFEGAML